MRIVGHADEHGNIRAIVVDHAPEGHGLMMAPVPGVTTMVELEGLPLADVEPTDPARIREIVRRYQLPPVRAVEVRPRD